MIGDDDLPPIVKSLRVSSYGGIDIDYFDGIHLGIDITVDQPLTDSEADYVADELISVMDRLHPYFKRVAEARAGPASCPRDLVDAMRDAINNSRKQQTWNTSNDL